jgi:hypothetical protein
VDIAFSSPARPSNSGKARRVVRPAGCRRLAWSSVVALLGVQRLSVAGAEGIEPPTFGFGDRRSAN